MEENKKGLTERIEELFELKFTDFTIFMLAIMVLSAIFGYIYEVIFYKIDLGIFVNRGSTFGPWIPIYGFGGIFITLFAYKIKQNPFYVFFTSCVISTIIELGTGFVLDKVFNMRLWDYNIEIWNWGNIGGYICARSVLFFGLSGLFLIYLLVPKLKKFREKIVTRFVIKAFNIPIIVISSIYIVDIIINMLI